MNARALGAALAGVFLAAASAWGAPPNLPPPAEYLPTASLSEAQAREALEAFREAGPPRPTYLEFVLKHLPRRGPEKDFPGRLWASRNEDGAVYRIELDAGPHFLLQNGPRARVWRAQGGDAAAVSPLEPLMPGLEVTAFDLQRPYLYWSREGAVTVSRIRGRPADVFVFRAPATGFGDIAAVRAFLDSEYHAPVQVESLAASGSVLRTFSLVDLRKVGGDWEPKDIDVRDEATRSKTRFTLTGAAPGLDLSPALFEPSGLGGATPPPAGVERWGE